MKLSLGRFFLTVAVAISGMALFTITTATASAGEVEDFVAKLKAHYQKMPPLKVFSMTHNYLYLGGNGAYRSWDYQAPNRYTAFKVTEFDLEKKHYVENVIHNYAGGRRFDETHFQNDTDSFRYAKNGLPHGRRLVRQSVDDFESFKNIIMVNIDFFAVKPLLEESNTSGTIKFHRNKMSGKTTLIHKPATDKVVEYVFSDNPLRLLSINNKSMRRIYFYDDYQTTNGFSFARSIVQYYNGATTPTFIKRIESLDILEEIDPAKLQIPQGYGPIIPINDGILVSKEIAPDLYLVTDSSALRNVLFKVNGDEIAVFGAPVNTELAEQTIKLILGQFPKKKIASVYVTHPHSDHIAGLPAYAKRGIMIRADAYSIAGIKAYPRFIADIATFKFQVIEHNQMIDGIHFYVLENTHSKRQSFVHFKDSGIIYQADFLDVAFDNTMAKELPSYSKTFIDFVRNRKLKFSRIVGHHRNNNVSLDVMNITDEANM
ncbi:MAG: hypothetical protein COB37_11290 [Kordiimonadales bacterium]|nr:MAG: hypothetical protein COB37_11290 [Kordiimonadales bacterium]